MVVEIPDYVSMTCDSSAEPFYMTARRALRKFVLLYANRIDGDIYEVIKPIPVVDGTRYMTSYVKPVHVRAMSYLFAKQPLEDGIYEVSVLGLMSLYNAVDASNISMTQSPRPAIIPSDLEDTANIIYSEFLSDMYNDQKEACYRYEDMGINLKDSVKTACDKNRIRLICNHSESFRTRLNEMGYVRIQSGSGKDKRKPEKDVS